METRKAYLYVFDTMSDWEYGYLIAELNSGRYFKKDIAPLRVVTVGFEKEVITTMGGLAVKPELSLDECTFRSQDLIILPGGNTWGVPNHQEILRKATEAAEHGSIIAAICGATVGLADIGFLDTRKHTSNDLDYLKMVSPHYKGEACFAPEPVVSSGNLVTASGVAPLEFAKEVLTLLDVFEAATLRSWYHLNKTQQPEYFFQLMNSLEK
ncbi:type 1 glutamine amidotransferase family protein [Sporosarcina sp. Te-1]|uniref:type 1 glutamine amidotransferase family protein n=1 Tax=Sporosarcina sp. Te-1 TaxID=2818390 RepID=UPI001A9EA1D6|nr:type 1 glutamine amidotransferase family protein [Sporosarcina sp. Te-1]QTD43278.1 glutamine amidotransferase [Sporosarcina sp. Te-1]